MFCKNIFFILLLAIDVYLNSMISSIASIYKKLPSRGSSPVVVLCEGAEDYACKYGRPHNLFNEFLAAHFCHIWGIPVPKPEIIKISQDHLMDGLHKKDFDIPCYGSHYMPYAKDLNDFFVTWKGNYYELNKITNKYDFLKIGLFDLWLSNEDRNHNNANLLINPHNDGYSIVAIDHVNIFNTNTLEHGLNILTEDESILTSEYTKILFKKGENIETYIKKIEEMFYVCVDECKAALPTILNNIPKEWNINIEQKEELIQQIFNEEWLSSCISAFKRYLAESLT